MAMAKVGLRECAEDGSPGCSALTTESASSSMVLLEHVLVLSDSSVGTADLYSPLGRFGHMRHEVRL